MKKDVVVVGAGVAGLACARALSRAGADVVVLDKGRGVGGRCATWRYKDQPIDYGVSFLHGSDQEFLAALESVEGATRLEGWPVRIEGHGIPCQPAAFNPQHVRVIFAEGLTVFPKHLALGIDVYLRTRAVRIDEVGGDVRVVTDEGEHWVAHDVAVTLPVAQARALLGTIAPSPPALKAVDGLLGMLATIPCLTVMAVYEPDAPRPAWDMILPEDSRVLHLVSHDSAKRLEPEHLAIVCQALPHWSRRNMNSQEETWTGEILKEAARLMGSWAASPLWSRSHRWQFARADGGSELSGPLLVELPGGSRIGLAGEVFGEEVGVQAAYVSGRRLADRIQGREKEEP